MGDVVLVDILLNLNIDVDIDRICNMGKIPTSPYQFQQLRPSTYNPFMPVFLETCDQHKMMLATPTDHHIREKTTQNCLFDRKFAPYALKVYKSFEIPSEEEESLFLTFQRKQAHIISTYSRITRKCMGQVKLIGDFTQDSYHVKAQDVINMSDIKEYMALNSLTESHSNTEVLAMLAHINKEFPGETVSIRRARRFLDFIVTVNDKEFGYDICSTRPGSDNFDRSVLIKTQNLATLAGTNKIIFCNFFSEYKPYVEKLRIEQQKMIDYVEPSDMQKLYTNSGLNVDNARNIIQTTPKSYDSKFFIPNAKNCVIIDAHIGIDCFNKNK
jgi:hypothetical protein